MSLAHFSPVLRAKQGEIEAIGRLSNAAKAVTQPVLDLPRARDDAPERVAEHIAEVLRSVRDSWGTAAPLYLDFSRYEPDARVLDDEHVVPYAFRIASQLKLRALPSTGSIAARGPTSAYIDAVRSVADGCPTVLVRLDPEEFASAESLESTLGTLNAVLSLPTQRIDIYLDTHAITDDASPVALERLASSALAAARFVLDSQYNRVIFGGSSYPEPMSKISRSPVVHLPCYEWKVWREIAAGIPKGTLGFGSYGVVHPRQSDSSKTGRPPSRVRLITERSYSIFRGAPEEIRELCRQALQDSAFSEVEESWGLGELRACAEGRGGTGNATTWIARDTCMHLQQVAMAVRRELTSKGVQLPNTQERSPTPWLQSTI